MSSEIEGLSKALDALYDQNINILNKLKSKKPKGGRGIRVSQFGNKYLLNASKASAKGLPPDCFCPDNGSASSYSYNPTNATYNNMGGAGSYTMHIGNWLLTSITGNHLYANGDEGESLTGEYNSRFLDGVWKVTGYYDAMGLTESEIEWERKAVGAFWTILGDCGQLPGYKKQGTGYIFLGDSYYLGEDDQGVVQYFSSGTPIGGITMHGEDIESPVEFFALRGDNTNIATIHFSMNDPADTPPSGDIEAQFPYYPPRGHEDRAEWNFQSTHTGALLYPPMPSVPFNLAYDSYENPNNPQEAKCKIPDPGLRVAVLQRPANDEEIAEDEDATTVAVDYLAPTCGTALPAVVDITSVRGDMPIGAYRNSYSGPRHYANPPKAGKVYTPNVQGISRTATITRNMMFDKCGRLTSINAAQYSYAQCELTCEEQYPEHDFGKEICTVRFHYDSDQNEAADSLNAGEGAWYELMPDGTKNFNGNPDHYMYDNFSTIRGKVCWNRAFCWYDQENWFNEDDYSCDDNFVNVAHTTHSWDPLADNGNGAWDTNQEPEQAAWNVSARIFPIHGTNTLAGIYPDHDDYEPPAWQMFTDAWWGWDAVHVGSSPVGSYFDGNKMAIVT